MSTIGDKYFHFCPSLDFPGGSDGKESACNAGDPDLIPGLGRFPWRTRQLTSVSLSGEFHGQRSLVGYIVHGVTLSDYHFHFFSLWFKKRERTQLVINIFIFVLCCLAQVMHCCVARRLGSRTFCIVNWYKITDNDGFWQFISYESGSDLSILWLLSFSH